jgi:hypothetical protein
MTKKPSTAIGAMSPDDTRLVKKRVLGNHRTASGLQKHTDRFLKGWHYCILLNDLDVATDPLTGYTQAQAKIIFYLEGDVSLDMVEADVDPITITNRSLSNSLATGDVLLTKFIIKEWAPIWSSGGGTLRHGIVSANLGCGYYTIQLGRFTGDLNSSGVGLGASSDSSGFDRNCDVCYDVVGEGTDECGITLSYPACPVTGNGTFVTAYHRASALVPLVLGSAVMLTGSGNEDEASSSSTDSSGSSSSVWHIVDGLQEHTVQYLEEWSCCDGEDESQEETLLTRTPVIFPAKVCEPIQCGTCAVPSSS